MRLPTQVVVLVLCALVATSCGGGSGEPAAAPAPAEAGAPAATSTREQAPEVAGTSLEGDPIALTDYRGGAVLVNVWSSW